MLSTPIYQRWADLDSLNHVNNVRFGEWAHEGLLAAQEHGLIPVGEPRRCRIDFLRPILPHAGRLDVLTEASGQDVQQSIMQGDVRYAAITSSFDTENPAPRALTAGVGYQIHARRVEARHDGSFAFSRVFEFLQEARVETFTSMADGSLLGTIVIARIDASFYAPLFFRERPFQALTAATKIGTSSIELTTQIIEENQVLVEAVTTTVAFDLETQSSRPLSTLERTAYEALMIS